MRLFAYQVHTTMSRKCCTCRGCVIWNWAMSSNIWIQLYVINRKVTTSAFWQCSSQWKRPGDATTPTKILKLSGQFSKIDRKLWSYEWPPSLHCWHRIRRRLVWWAYMRWSRTKPIRIWLTSIGRQFWVWLDRRNRATANCNVNTHTLWPSPTIFVFYFIYFVSQTPPNILHDSAFAKSATETLLCHWKLYLRLSLEWIRHGSIDASVANWQQQNTFAVHWFLQIGARSFGQIHRPVHSKSDVMTDDRNWNSRMNLFGLSSCMWKRVASTK